ncbi:predicted protein [Streptomyces viridosporus ATCC 14672]|uniref:Predicted protein n=1 Tax=Streptomyces viridosporus (strain ATCC 14672 / DSM 40746 / JCM 4963 / KCTC 9882 / NRRL B-12104 / FH 1290) TaxID=566461 RepID=D5ZT88_STRV1|nr:predicted protein [Streptomyces viridosporus ATCC 14672]
MRRGCGWHTPPCGSEWVPAQPRVNARSATGHSGLHPGLSFAGAPRRASPSVVRRGPFALVHVLVRIPSYP